MRFMSWYYKRENEICGPFAAGDIRQLIEQKAITPETDLTQAPENDEWVPAGESEFAKCFEEAQPPSLLPWLIAIVIILILGQAMLLSSGKPVIYLYPEREMDVRVRLEYDGKLDATYPAYPEGGWHVTARPDGTLIDKTDGHEYSYLFWDGFYDNQFDFSRGFIVKGKDTARFLQDTLSAMGLTPREYNEFIVYWLPKMQHNAWNLIAFQGAEYTDHARLTITPKPDSLLRVFMAFKSVPYPYAIPPQTFPKFERRGFTVIEWGGSDAGDKRLKLW